MARGPVILFLMWMGLAPGIPAGQCGEPESRPYVQSGIKNMQDEKYAEAAAAFQKALEQDPERPDLMNALGVAYLHMDNKFDEALSSFEESIRMKPDYAEAYFNLGLSYAQYRQDPLSAKEYFEKALALDPKAAKSYHSLGLIYMMAENNPYRAAELFSQAIELEPNLFQAHYALGLCYVMMGKRSQALGPITTLRRLNQEQYAMSLESLVRGEGGAMGQEAPQESSSNPQGQPEKQNPDNTGG